MIIRDLLPQTHTNVLFVLTERLFPVLRKILDTLYSLLDLLTIALFVTQENKEN